MRARALSFGFPMSEGRAGVSLAPFVDAFRESTAMTLEPRWLPNYEAFTAACEHELELAWTPPVIAVELSERGKMRPLVAIERQGEANYHAAIVVPIDSPIRHTRQLAGKRMAWVSATSASGYLVPRLYLVSRGLDPRSMFREEQFAGSHHAAIAAAISGEADAACIYAHEDKSKSGGFRLAARDTELRIIATAGPIPGDIMMIRASLSESVARSVSSALLSLRGMGLWSIRSAMGVECFGPIPRGHLEPLRKLAAQARAPLPPRA